MAQSRIDRACSHQREFQSWRREANSGTALHPQSLLGLARLEARESFLEKRRHAFSTVVVVVVGNVQSSDTVE
jgi:hypothetical protein